MRYMIHKSLDLTVEQINDSLENCYEFEGVEVSLHRAGPLIIAEPVEIAKRDIKRNPDDYVLYDDFMLKDIPAGKYYQ